MYSVSQAYLTAMAQPVHMFKILGYVGNSAFTEANVLHGSLSITNQCSNGNDIVVGAVNIGVLKCTFIGIDVDEGDEISLSEGLKLANETYEYIPLGVYRVAEANRTKSGTVITAYDHMSDFDKAFTFDTTYGTPYAIANLACTECGVSFGMTIAEVQDLQNGTETLTMYEENDIQTWRDVIFWLAQAMACIAMMDRSGRLVFRPFGQTAELDIDNYARYQGASFSNFVIKYTGISVVDKTGDGDQTVYYGLEPDDGLTYNLGANPFLQFGGDEVKDRIRTNTLNGIANIAYTPFKASVSVGALFDLCDVIQHTDGLAEDASVSCIMRYVWKYNNGYQMEGIGKNPTITNAKSKTDKQIQQLAASIKTDALQYYLFTNAENITIPDGDQKKIIDVRFVSSKKTVVMFQAEILVEADTEDVVKAKFTYRFNDIYMNTRKPTETLIDGEHILHLLKWFEIDSAMVSRLEVFLEADGGDISISMASIEAGVYGQGLVGTQKWDGIIEIRQEINTQFVIGTPYAGMTARGINESFASALDDPTDAAITEEFGRIVFGTPNGIVWRDIEENVSVVTTEEE